LTISKSGNETREIIPRDRSENGVLGFGGIGYIDDLVFYHDGSFALYYKVTANYSVV